MPLRLRDLRAPRRRKRLPPPNPPDAVTLRYAAEIKRLLRPVHALIRREVLPLLETAPGLTLDSPQIFDLKTLLYQAIHALLRDTRTFELLKRIGSLVSKHATSELTRVMGIPLTDVVSQQTLETFARENVAKITSLATSELDRVYETITVAQVKGLRVEELRDNIVEQFGVSESYGALLARDQTLKLNGQISEQRQTEVGIVRYRWSTSKDSRVREEHRELDGTEQRWAEAPVTSKDGRRNHPGRDFQCRCVAVPIIDDVLG
jgi:SPP1 gp7 family putative phage head morphogenesis protein